MADIRHLLSISAPAERVYEAITEQSGLAGWWTTQTVAKPNVGSTLEFKFGEKYHNKMRLTQLVPNQRVQWECLDGHHEWVGTQFLFTLEDLGDRTTLRFAQQGWAAMTDFFAHCNTTWAYYLDSLKSLCETGQGRPFQGEEEAGTPA